MLAIVSLLKRTHLGSAPRSAVTMFFAAFSAKKTIITVELAGRRDYLCYNGILTVYD